VEKVIRARSACPANGDVDLRIDYPITKHESFDIGLVLLYLVSLDRAAVSQACHLSTMAETTDHELGVLDNTTNTNDDEISAAELQGLPPVDGGIHAWMTLVACFLLEASIWGYALSSLYVSAASC
jgi:hypothetical protein